MNKTFYNFGLDKCPVRSAVRTQDFHSCNRGSIPLRDTTKTPDLRSGVFYYTAKKLESSF